MSLASVLIASYLVILLLLAVYGFHRSQLVYLYFKHRRRIPTPAGTFETPPVVTVQLPFFNEMYVAERLLAPEIAAPHQVQAAVQPPSMQIIAPVIERAISPDRKTASAPISSTLTKRLVA